MLDLVPVQWLFHGRSDDYLGVNRNTDPVCAEESPLAEIDASSLLPLVPAAAEADGGDVAAGADAGGQEPEKAAVPEAGEDAAGSTTAAQR